MRQLVHVPLEETERTEIGEKKVKALVPFCRSEPGARGQSNMFQYSIQDYAAFEEKDFDEAKFGLQCNCFLKIA
jgi:hypothetical protein